VRCVHTGPKHAPGAREPKKALNAKYNQKNNADGCDYIVHNKNLKNAHRYILSANILQKDLDVY